MSKEQTPQAHNTDPRVLFVGKYLKLLSVDGNASTIAKIYDEHIASAPLLRELLERVIELGITADHAKSTHKLNSIIQDAKKLLK